MMVDTIFTSFTETSGRLRRFYGHLTGADGGLDTGLAERSLWFYGCGPARMAADQPLPRWFAEVMRVWLASLTENERYVEHRFAGLQRLLGDVRRGLAIRAAIEMRDLSVAPLDAAQVAALNFARKLSLSPAEVGERDLARLRRLGYGAAAVRQIRRIVAEFCDTSGAGSDAQGLGGL